ncbi:MAG: TonB-dependent receptor [Bryobacterales bacterium]|nr:TonB-dependent receptor [Bryobacterales bacterium]
MRATLLLLLSCCLLAQHSPPAPQPAPGSPPAPPSERPFFLKQEITVTATRGEVEPSQSPVSATVVSAQEIAIRNVQTVDQALDSSPGVYPNRGKGYQDTQAGVGMRGFAGRGTGQGRTLILIDGQPLNDPYTGQLIWTSLPVEEVERVEVVRGPFSALYGNNAMGGVVQILTRPVDRRHLELKGEYGSQDTLRYRLRAADRFFERLGVSFSYDRLQSGGYPSQFVTTAGTAASGGTPVTGFIPTLTTAGAPTYIIGRSGNNWWNQHAWRVRGDYTFTSRTTLAVHYLRQSSNYGYDAYTTLLRTAGGQPFDSGAAAILVAGSARRLSVSPSMFLPGDGGNRSHLASAKLHHSIAPNSRVRLGVGWVDAPLAYYTTPGSGSTLAGGPGLISDRPSRSWFGEAQWTWDANSRHTLTAGTELRRDSTSVAESNLSNYTRRKESPALSYAAQGKTLNQGGYAQHQWRLGEHLLLVSGGRYDYWHTYDGGNQTVGTTLVNRYSERSSHSVSGKAALLYRAPREFVLRASLGNAYRSPAVYDLYRTWRSSSGVIYASNPDLKPETLLAWEAGVTRRWNGGFEMDGVFFQNHVSDLIYRSTDLSVDPRGAYRPVVNAAEARTRGFEGALRAPIGPGLFARASYTWTGAEITRNPAIPASVGRRIPQVPSHNTSLGLFAARRRWTASLTGRYVSSVFSTDTNTDTTKGVYGAFDPFFEADASVSVDISRRLAFQVSAENLLNRVYFNYYPVRGRLIFTGFRVRL